MATIKSWLNEAGFNWKKGRIILQPGDGWDQGGNGQFVSANDPTLSREFDSGFGSPECPRFIAEDDKNIYFPSQYDGATALEVIYKDIMKYIKEPSPYPGG